MDWARYKESLLNTLGECYYSDDQSIIFNLDCEESILKLSENKILINSTITSPPYNIGKEYEKIMSIDAYISWLTRIFNQIHKITTSNGSLLLNLGYLEVPGKGRAVPITYLIWNTLPFYLIQEIIWNYGAGVAAKNFLSPRNEKILWMVKDSLNYTFNLDSIRDPDVKYPFQKKNGKIRVNSIGKNPSDVWQIAKVTSGLGRASTERTSHPAQFPLDLINRLILGFTNEFDVVLDPFIGSGTTAVSCKIHKRYTVGFEINKNYCEIASKRLDSEKKLLGSTLFV